MTTAATGSNSRITQHLRCGSGKRKGRKERKDKVNHRDTEALSGGPARSWRATAREAGLCNAKRSANAGLGPLVFANRFALHRAAGVAGRVARAPLRSLRSLRLKRSG